MKKILLFSVLYLSSILCVFANQNDSIQIVELQQKVNDLKVDIRQMQLANQQQEEIILTISSELSLTKDQLAVQNDHIDSFTNKVGMDIETTDKKIDDSSHTLYDSIQQYTFWLWTCIVVIIVLIVAVFLILRRKIRNSSSSIDSIKEAQEKIRSTQESIEKAQNAMREESVKLDSKLVELLEKQLIVQPQENVEEVHDLVKSIATEVARIEQNLAYMDSNIRGVANLRNRAAAIKTTLLSRGYEIPSLIGRNYHEGDNMKPTMELDEELPIGTQIIRRVMKPMVLYKGKQIQAAEVVVAYNE